MADVTGPIRSLPGSRHDLPKGAMCDDHPDTPAVARIQGETDSMGSEMHDLCQKCLDEMKQQGPRVCTCDWCKTRNVETKPMRDYEEGMCGRVYDVCHPCRDLYHKRQAEELDMTEENNYQAKYG